MCFFFLFIFLAKRTQLLGEGRPYRTRTCHAKQWPTLQVYVMKNNQNILHGALNGVYFLTHYRDTPNSCIYTLKKTFRSLIIIFF